MLSERHVESLTSDESVSYRLVRGHRRAFDVARNPLAEADVGKLKPSERRGQMNISIQHQPQNTSAASKINCSPLPERGRYQGLPNRIIDWPPGCTIQRYE